MTCPKCAHAQNPANTECAKCGIVFEKYYRLREARNNTAGAEADGAEDANGIFAGVIMHVPDTTNIVYVCGRALVLLAVFLWGWTFILASPAGNAAGNSFMHLVNLPFHEAGHIFFGIFGQFIGALGGSLGQLIIPCVCLLVLLLKTRDPFGASVALWWLGQNFIDLAPYINDARSLTLPLLGGNTGGSSPYGFHDWQFILTELHLLKYDHTLAGLSHGLGCAVMLTACLWGSAVLVKQYSNREGTTRGGP